MPNAHHYRAVREGAALAAVPDRARIGLTGGDRRSFLHGLLTNDIAALAPGTGCYAAWLTPQGRMTTDMHVLESGDMILLDVPAANRESMLQRLDQFIFSEDVQVTDLTPSLGAIAVHGPLAAGAVARALSMTPDLEGWAQYRNVRASVGGTAVVVARIDQLGVPGFTIYMPPEQESALRDALSAAGAVAVGEETVEAARVEAGYPRFGADMDDDIIPLEAGIEGRAISFDKGCYVGQEVIVRVLHRGHGRVARRLVGLRLDGDAIPQARARIHAGGRDAGFVTSAAASPRFGTIALGYVHRDFVQPGSAVEVEAGGGRLPATVSALPFA